MVKFSVSFNEIESNNKYINPVLYLETVWVTRCDWLRLCTTVAILISDNIFWKLFYHGVKIYYYDNVIVII